MFFFSGDQVQIIYKQLTIYIHYCLSLRAMTFVSVKQFADLAENTTRNIYNYIYTSRIKAEKKRGTQFIDIDIYNPKHFGKVGRGRPVAEGII